MDNIQEIKIFPNNTIKQAMRILDSTSLQILLVIDEQDSLIGTITDGDIRRTLLKTDDLTMQVHYVMNKNPIIGHINQSTGILKHIMLENKIKQLPIVDNNKKVQDVIFLESFIHSNERKNSEKVILMAGGLGTRLRPLTNEVPKPMLTVGKKPILETIIKRFSEQNFEDFIICVNYKKEIIQNYFQDGKGFGVNIEYIEENTRLGTAGALSLIPSESFNNQPVILMNGDILTNLDFNKLLKKHKEKNYLATICVRNFEYTIPYGVIEKDNNGGLHAIKEKPTYNFLTNAGIYILSREVINLIPQNQFFDMPQLMEILISKEVPINVEVLRDYWIDIGQMKDYEKANLEFGDEFNV